MRIMQNKRQTFIKIILVLLAIAGSSGVMAQNGAGRQQAQPQLPPELMPKHPAGKEGVRASIDAKRSIENIYSDDALPRSREYKRSDSTYYVGWMYEGVYKFNHAADYLGYKNAAVPLERAFNLLEHDYAKALSTRSDNLLAFYPVYKFHVEYAMIANFLMNCYSNTDQPEKVNQLLRRTLRWKFQRQFFDTYNYLAWTVHRNRFYTHSKYSFLRNSIDENEKLANSYLDTSLMLIERNKAINSHIFSPKYVEEEQMSVYHYKNMLYSYSFNIDSASYYFELMRDAGRLPHNNYATFRAVCGDFKTAEAEYKIASNQENDKRLQEWAYYSSIIDIYKGQPKTGIALAKGMIQAAGSTPGYGWYNIALARAMLYDGQISEAQRYVDRAAEFKELHIGTTLGQSHYDFSTQLIKLINKEQAWQMDQFEHSNWWYNPSVLLSMANKLSEKYLQQFLIINQFSQNPERERVIYKLFSNESTVSWDEIWYLVHDFSTQYFIDRFEQEARTDKRVYIRKYFELFTARLKMQQGKYKEAKNTLDKLLHDPNTDAEYKKLFIARLYQAEAECAKHAKDEAGEADWLYRMYLEYPQLIPFSGLQMPVNLHISGSVDKEVGKRLRGCNIKWVTNGSLPAVNAYVQFGQNGTKKNITCYVLDRNGNYVVPKQSFAWQKAEEAGTAIAYRLFNIGGKEEEAPAARKTATLKK